MATAQLVQSKHEEYQRLLAKATARQAPTVAAETAEEGIVSAEWVEERSQTRANKARSDAAKRQVRATRAAPEEMEIIAGVAGAEPKQFGDVAEDSETEKRIGFLPEAGREPLTWEECGFTAATSAPSTDRRAGALKVLAKTFRAAADALEAFAESVPAPAAPLLRYREAALQLACNRSTVARLAARGALDLVQVGEGSPRITSESIARLIAKGGVRSARRRRSTLIDEIRKAG